MVAPWKVRTSDMPQGERTTPDAAAPKGGPMDLALKWRDDLVGGSEPLGLHRGGTSGAVCSLLGGLAKSRSTRFAPGVTDALPLTR